MFLAHDTIAYMKRLPGFGYNIGFLGEYYFNEKISLGAELLFARQGYIRTWTNSYDHPAIIPANEKAICKTYHINIPIIFRYYIDNLAFEIGPQVSFCFGGNLKYVLEQTIHDYTSTFDTLYHFSDWESATSKDKDLPGFKAWNRISVGATAGMSVNLENGMFIGVRYTFDFTNSFHEAIMIDEKPTWSDEVFKSHHSVLTASIGFKL